MIVTPYPAYNSVFKSDSLFGIFHPLCSISGYGEGANDTLHFVAPYPNWGFEKFKTDQNGAAFCIFELVDDKYAFSGNIDFYAPQPDRKEILQTLDRQLVKHFELSNERFSVDNYIKNWGYHLKGSDSEHLIKEYDKYFFAKYSWESRIGTNTRKATKPIPTPKIEKFNVDKNDHSSGFTDILVNAEYILPSIILNEWVPIGVAYSEYFLPDTPDTYLFLHENKRQTLCVYGSS